MPESVEVVEHSAPAPEVTPAAPPEPSTPAARTFDEKYVGELRQEAASYRVKAKEYEDAFSGYTPEQKAALLDLTRQLADPKTSGQAAKRMREIAEAILDDPGGTTPTGEVDPEKQPMTRAEFKAAQEQQEASRSQNEAIRKVNEDAAALGFKPSAAPGSEEAVRYMMLLQFAQDPDVAGDLTKAAQKVESYERGVIDSYRTAVQTGKAKWPPVSTSGEAAPNEPTKPPTDFREAKRATKALFKAKAGQIPV